MNCFWFSVLLPPTMKLRQGNIFTPVCDSVHRGVSVPGSLSQGGLCPGPGGSLSGGLCPGGLCPGGSLSRGGLCPGGSMSRKSLSRGISVQGSLCPGESLSGRPPMWLHVGGTYPTGMYSC